MLLRLLRRIVLAESKLHIDIRANELRTILSSSTESLRLDPRKTETQTAETAKSQFGEPIVTLSAQVTFKRRGVETKIILEGAASLKRCQPDPALIKTIARANVWFKDIMAGRLT